jgi:hypothetical protein
MHIMLPLLLPQIIHSTYELEVRAKTGCCLSEVAVRKPILLNDPQPVELPPTMVPPQDWAPLVRGHMHHADTLLRTHVGAAQQRSAKCRIPAINCSLLTKSFEPLALQPPPA